MCTRPLSVLLIPALLLLTAGWIAAPTALAASNKVTICHVPPDDPGNAHEIVVSERAIASHLKNHPGDVVGPCPESECSSGADCNDADACTIDVCKPDGSCDHSQPVVCEDGNPCTLDACDPFDGCVNPPVPDGDLVSCDDGNTCSSSDVCVGGACTGEAIPDCCTNDIDCPEDDACTVRFCADNTCQEADISGRCTGGGCEVAFCDPASGCGTTPVTCPDDGDFCTIAVCDPAACGDVGACVTQTNPNPPETPEVTCDDGLDNDCDGLADLSDPDCAGCDEDGTLILNGVDYAGSNQTLLAWEACRSELAFHPDSNCGDAHEEICEPLFVGSVACDTCIDSGSLCIECKLDVRSAAWGYSCDIPDFGSCETGN